MPDRPANRAVNVTKRAVHALSFMCTRLAMSPGAYVSGLIVRDYERYCEDYLASMPARFRKIAEAVAIQRKTNEKYGEYLDKRTASLRIEEDLFKQQTGRTANPVKLLVRRKEPDDPIAAQILDDVAEHRSGVTNVEDPPLSDEEIDALFDS